MDGAEQRGAAREGVEIRGGGPGDSARSAVGEVAGAFGDLEQFLGGLAIEAQHLVPVHVAQQFIEVRVSPVLSVCF